MPSQGKKHSEMFQDGLNEEVTGSTSISQCPAAQMYRKKAPEVVQGGKYYF